MNEQDRFEPPPPGNVAGHAAGNVAGTAGPSATQSGTPGAVPPPPYTYTAPAADYATPPPGTYAVPHSPGLPNPATAFVLGFIPGVGAMYNGQFAKGIANIAIFAILVSIADHISPVFGIFVAGWIAFMVFDAFQTARARRFGLPLPNPFGLNDIGERFGFGPSAGWTPTAPPANSPPPTQGFYVDPAGNVYTPRDPTTVGNTPMPGYAGTGSSVGTADAYGSARAEVRPGSPGAPAPPFAPPAASAAPSPFAPPVTPPFAAQAYPPGPYTYAPYNPPPMPDWAVPPAPFAPPALQPATGLASVPAGALWLIGLGLVALLGSLQSFYFFNGQFTGAFLLLLLGGFLLFRRWQQAAGVYSAGSPEQRWAFLSNARGPGILIFAGLLTLLEAVHLVRWSASWPSLLIFIGVLLLLERVAYNRLAESLSPPPPYSAPPAAGPAPETEPSPTGPASAAPPPHGSTPHGSTSHESTPHESTHDREGR